MEPREWIPASKNLIKDKWTSHISESLRRKDYCFKSQRAAAPDSSSNKSHYSAATSDLFAGWLIFRSLWAFLPFFPFFFCCCCFQFQGETMVGGISCCEKKNQTAIDGFTKEWRNGIKTHQEASVWAPDWATYRCTDEQICEAQLIWLLRRIAGALVGVSIASELKL